MNTSNYHGSVSIFYGSKEGTDYQRYIMMNVSTYLPHLSVVDQSLKVYGTDGLYVMDASVIPEIPSSPTNPLVIAMAELFAEKIQS